MKEFKYVQQAWVGCTATSTAMVININDNYDEPGKIQQDALDLLADWLLKENISQNVLNPT